MTFAEGYILIFKEYWTIEIREWRSSQLTVISTKLCKPGFNILIHRHYSRRTLIMIWQPNSRMSARNSKRSACGSNPFLISPWLGVYWELFRYKTPDRRPAGGLFGESPPVGGPIHNFPNGPSATRHGVPYRLLDLARVEAIFVNMARGQRLGEGVGRPKFNGLRLPVCPLHALADTAYSLILPGPR